MFWVALKQIVLYSTEFKINKNKKNKKGCTIKFNPKHHLNLYGTYYVEFLLMLY